MATTAKVQNVGRETSSVRVGFHDLFAAHEPPCVSIFMNLEAGFGAAERNLLKLKGLLHDAEALVLKAPIALAETSDFFNAAWRCIDQLNLNPRKEGGIGLFIAEDFFRFYVLPAVVREHISIGTQFFVRPILPTLANDNFFLLALSQDHLKLFQGTATELHEVFVKDVPGSLREDFESQSFERENQFHTASPAGVGRQAAIHHGPHIQQKDRILRFFRDVDSGIAARLKGQSGPLVLAAVHYLMPIYHQVNSYPHLLDEGIFGNPDSQKGDLLLSAARAILEKHYSQERDSVLKMFSENTHTGLTSTNLREVVAAAAGGRVRFLLIPDDAEQWGIFDFPDTVHLHAHKEAGDDELLNLAAVLALRDGGQVFVAPKHSFPQGAPLAAIYRF
ncbi:MAG TPA: hypothetical protein VLV89_13970 [Candidatus Acidoferrum sp.]|nr:hypothetical protein [Candidatus Acidoferrum sp.]